MKKNPLLVSLILLIFFVISFLTNIIGPLVPDIIKSFDLSLKMASFLPFSFFVAYGLMSIPSGFLIENYGEKKIMIMAFLISSIGAFLFSNTGTYSFYLISLFLIGTGMAMLQVAINPLLRTIGGEKEFAFNSVLGQMFFGLASFISPLVYSYIINNVNDQAESSNLIISLLNSIKIPEMEWISLYWIFAIISFIMVIIISQIKLPIVEKKEDEKVGALQTHLTLLKKPIVLLYFIAIFCYVGTEVGVANWISQFLETYHDINPQIQGAKTVSNFWGMMTLGTLLGLVLLKFIDSRKVLIINSIISILALLVALFGTSQQALIAFPVIGFFIATMWSIIISLALNSVSDSHGSFSGILVTGIIGGAFIPFIVGAIGDVFGLKTGLLFLIITLLFILSIGFWAKPLINNKTFSN
ncbi:MAG: MFS transporter [Flavobacteriaceae bacterium]|nr:MFS transporter [Flavobacteriaceae bacterium]|tara:strand:- start:6229 stop:7467 length:1239 start_codon:yes stop_codon:yes gene_type:complete